jgi:ATP-binding cassette subfamily B protein
MSSEFIAHASYRTNHSSALRFILSHIRRHPVFGLSMVFGAFSNAALAAAVPYFIGIAFNTIINGGDLAIVGQVALAVIGSQALRGGLQLMRNFSSEIFAQRIERDVRDELYASLLGKSMAFHDFQPIGEIMARVTNDVREMNLMMNPGMNLLIGSGMFLLVPVLAAPRIHPQLVVVPATFVTLYVILQYRYITALHPIAEEVRSTFGHLNARLAETLEGLQVVKGAAKEDVEISQFNRLADEVRNRYIAQGVVEARYLVFLLLGLTMVAAFVHSIVLYQAGEINAGDMVAFMGMLFNFGFPVFSSQTSLSQAWLRQRPAHSGHHQHADRPRPEPRG